MELPKRPKGDEYARPGRYGELQNEVRRRVESIDPTALFIYAFDFRTRVGPFLFIDKVLIPGAPTAVGAALHAAGIRDLRLVLQQWSPKIRPSQARINGRRPELLFISSMQIHSDAAYELIQDAWSLGDDRPLILAGGPKAIYEPWDFFGLSADGKVGADVVVTGEELVTLELLDRVFAHKAHHESLRQAFDRARREGLLNDIPGLVFRPDDSEGPPKCLINTGIQRLVQDLDELAMPIEALELFEPKHRRTMLAQRPIPIKKLKRTAKVLGVVMSHGCKFRCSYCPIPAYNQFTFRFKSPQRMADEMAAARLQTGIDLYFGTDDNFFNNRQAAEEIFEAMSRTDVGGKPFRDEVHWATEATEFDVYKNQDLLPLARDAGLRLIWFGIEDMTAELIKKGQSPDKTKSLFKTLLANDIGPMPMMMHHDGQPLWTRGSIYGLLNQARVLRRAGALSFQVTFLTPSVGSKGFEQPYEDGMVMAQVGDQAVGDHLYDGNHCIATHDSRPWRKQLNMLASYAYFYNPWHLFRSVFRFDGLWSYRLLFQMLGNMGVVWSAVKDRGWLRGLTAGRIEKLDQVPQAKYPIVDVEPQDQGLAVIDSTPVEATR